MDLDVVSTILLPGRTGQKQPDLANRLATRRADVVAVLDVAKGARDRERCGIVLEGAAGGALRAESGESQVQDGGAHLLADAAALVALSHPRPGAHLPLDSEIGRAHPLHPDHRISLLDHHRAVPVGRLPVGPGSPVELEGGAWAKG